MRTTPSMRASGLPSVANDDVAVAQVVVAPVTTGAAPLLATGAEKVAPAFIAEALVTVLVRPLFVVLACAMASYCGANTQFTTGTYTFAAGTAHPAAGGGGGGEPRYPGPDEAIDPARDVIEAAELRRRRLLAADDIRCFRRTCCCGGGGGGSGPYPSPLSSPSSSYTLSSSLPPSLSPLSAVSTPAKDVRSLAASLPRMATSSSTLHISSASSIAIASVVAAIGSSASSSSSIMATMVASMGCSSSSSSSGDATGGRSSSIGVAPENVTRRVEAAMENPSTSSSSTPARLEW